MRDLDIVKQRISSEDWEESLSMMSEYIKREDFHYDEEIAILMATILMHIPNGRSLAFDHIVKGLELSPDNYELYLMLGEWYASVNPSKAFLCFENALYLCERYNGDEHDDTNYLYEYLNSFACSMTEPVPLVSFVILSWNTLDLTRNCIESIRDTCYRDSYELIIVDNGSKDGSVEWLSEQDDIILIKNSENVGFAKGCNQGARRAKKGNDIFFLNSDTEMMFNSLFQLRMALYDSEDIGAVGAVSNSIAPGQRIDEIIKTPDEGRIYARKKNIPSRRYMENKEYLIGFAEIIRGDLLNAIGGFDEEYQVGYYEDNDIGLRIIKQGYKNVCVHNSFIFHWGNKSFVKNKVDCEKQLLINQRIFEDKWGFNAPYYGHLRKEIIALIDCARDSSIEVLEIGCGSGTTLSRIEYLYPNSVVHGIDISKQAVELGKSKGLNIHLANVETDDFPYELNSMDYIILADVLEHLKNSEEVLQKAKKYLKKSGKIIVSLPNLLNARVIYNLLHGFFAYEDSGILDRDHIRFFTYKEIMLMIDRNGFAVDCMGNIVSEYDSTGQYDDFFDHLCEIDGVVPREMFDVYQYVFRIKKNR